MSDRYPHIYRPIYVVPGNNGLKIPTFNTGTEAVTEARIWIDQLLDANNERARSCTPSGETKMYLGSTGLLRASEINKYFPRDRAHASRKNPGHYVHEILGTPAVPGPELPAILRISDDPRSESLEVEVQGERLWVSKADESSAAFLITAAMRDVLSDLGCVPNEMGSRAVLLADYRLPMPESAPVPIAQIVA